jgi:hypothetical protein
MQQFGDFLVMGTRLAKEFRRRHPEETFKGAARRDRGVAASKLSVVGFARQFPLPGGDRLHGRCGAGKHSGVRNSDLSEP